MQCDWKGKTKSIAYKFSYHNLFIFFGKSAKKRKKMPKTSKTKTYQNLILGFSFSLY